MLAKSAKTLITAVAVTLVLLATPSSANAGFEDLSTARAATAGFHQVDAANAAGYGILVPDLAGITCIDSPGVGVMGIYYPTGPALGEPVPAPPRPAGL